MKKISFIIVLLVGVSIGWIHGMNENQQQSTYCKQIGCENEKFHN